MVISVSFFRPSLYGESRLSSRRDWNRRVNLAYYFFVGIVLEENCTRGALCVTQTVAFTDDGIDLSFLTLRR